MRIHAATLWQVDFFSKMVVTKTGLKQAFVLAFIHVESRRVICSPATFNPNRKWIVAQAEAMLEQARDAEIPVRHLVRDRDGCYVPEFDAVFENVDVRVEPTTPKAPTQNAYIERRHLSLKSEALDRFIVFSLNHLNHIVSEYVSHYHESRPHQSKDNKPLLGLWPDEDEPLDESERIVCRSRLGGVLKHYERVAA